MKLDLDLLKAFVAVIDSGTVSAAAKRTFRTQAAVSLQMGRLAEAAGARLLTRAGRRMIATEAGEALLTYARRMLALHDEAVMMVSGRDIAGQVRLGLTQDFAETALPPALAVFGRAHPAVTLDIAVDGTASLLRAMDDGRLDLVLGGRHPRADARPLCRAPMTWLQAPGATMEHWLATELPLAMFDPPCPFRAAALAALGGAGIRWRMAVRGPSLSGLLAAVRAGLAVTVRTQPCPTGLVAATTLPRLPEAEFALYHPEPAAPAVARLAAALADILAPNENQGRI